MWSFTDLYVIIPAAQKNEPNSGKEQKNRVPFLFVMAHNSECYQPVIKGRLITEHPEFRRLKYLFVHSMCSLGVAWTELHISDCHPIGVFPCSCGFACFFCKTRTNSYYVVQIHNLVGFEVHLSRLSIIIVLSTANLSLTKLYLKDA